MDEATPVAQSSKPADYSAYLTDSPDIPGHIRQQMIERTRQFFGQFGASPPPECL